MTPENTKHQFTTAVGRHGTVGLRGLHLLSLLFHVSGDTGQPFICTSALSSRKEDRQCTHNVTLLHVANHCCCAKAISIIYWSVRACWYPGAWASARACVHVALATQHATRMRHIVTSFVAPRSPFYFSILSHKRCDSRKKVTEQEMCVLIPRRP